MDVRTTVRILQDDIFGLWVKQNMVEMGMSDPLPEGTNTDAIFALLDGCVEFGRLTTVADDIFETILKGYTYKDYEELPMNRMVKSYRQLSKVVSELDDIISTVFKEYFDLPFKTLVDGYRELVKLSSNGDAPHYIRMRAYDAVHCLDALYFSSDDKATKAIKEAIVK